MINDNGSQFIGAERQLKEMIKGWDIEKLREFSAEKRIQWKFTTPASPHQNRCAEALVMSRKMALKKAIGEQMLAPFELYTCLLEVANLVNQRPIGRIPNDPHDGSYLCPNDILLGRSSSHVPQGPFRETKNPRCSENCGLVLEAVDKGCISVVDSTKEMERRETKCSSR